LRQSSSPRASPGAGKSPRSRDRHAIGGRPRAPRRNRILDPIAPNDVRAGSVPRELAAPAEGISLWWCELERTPAELALLAGTLTPTETARAARFGTEALRHRWMAGRAALREVLGRALGVAPAEVAIRRGVRGRPELADRSLRIDFNVSHTRSVALIAMARDVGPSTRIGVDIEHIDREVGVDRLQRKFLAPKERERIAGLSADLRRRRFLHYWTCKEAMSKATGDGIIAPFGELEVERGDPPQLRAGPPPYIPGDWSLVDAAVSAEWFATVAIWHRAR
jgi:4'-phosphopantetheinyl transferase